MDTARILVIDDEPVVTRLCRRILGREGFDVHGAINGDQGLWTFKQIRPELVLLDVNLPDRDGLEVLAAIQDIDPESAVIVITGHGTIDVAIAALKSGAQDFMRKPFPPEELVASVRGALERVRLRQENQRLRARLPILEISKALISETSPARLTQLALETVQQELDAVQVSLMLLDDSGEKLFISSALGLDDEVVSSTRVTVGQGPAGRAAQNKKPILVFGETVRDWDAAPWLSPPDIGSAICMPLLLQNRVLGVLNVSRLLGASPFRQDDVDLLSILCGQIAVALENARLHEQVQRHVEHLEQRVADRTKELVALYEVTAVASESLELEPTLRRSLEQALAAMDAGAGAIQLLDGEKKAPRLTVQQGTLPNLIAQMEPILLTSGLVDWVIEHNDPLVVPDVANDARIPFASGLGDATSVIGLRAYVGVPMRVRGETRGVLSVFGRAGQQFNVEDVALLASIADHVAVAAENAQLYEAERRRVEQFRLISEVGNRITSLLAVDDLLQEIVRLVKETLGYFRVGIGLIEGDEIVIGALTGRFYETSQTAPQRLKVGQQGIVGWVARSGAPLLAPNTRQEPRFYDRSNSEILSELAVPLKVKEEVIGVLDVQSDRLDAFDESDLAVLQSLANQAAVAIENAQLYEQAQQVAALEERERLARELHDSATQSLYSLSLFAEASRDLIGTGQFEDAGHYMARIGEIAQDALKEMRLMVHELRSPALEQEGLAGALRQRLEAVEKRVGIEARLLVEGQLDLPVPLEEELYRIALEALNNALKHAEATTVTVHIRATGGQVELAVTDDGRGFDLDAASSGGGMGLISMRERAERVDSTLKILSAPGKGTKIVVAVGNRQMAVDEGGQQ